MDLIIDNTTDEFNNLITDNPTDEYNNISAFISNLIIDNSRILHTTNSRTPNFLLLLEAIYIKYHSPSLNTGLKASKELNLFS